LGLNVDERWLMFQRIMVAYDESPEAEKALDVGIELARALGAEL
jgi:nucleotide-binding universal stress UspA family protein